jgi:hypothetical protein
MTGKELLQQYNDQVGIKGFITLEEMIDNALAEQIDAIDQFLRADTNKQDAAAFAKLQEIVKRAKEATQP